MLAKLHLAEDAFALHLSLQRLEGLINIVVADENLHAVLLFNPTFDVPSSGGGACTHGRGYALPQPRRTYSNRPLGGEKLRARGDQ